MNLFYPSLRWKGMEVNISITQNKYTWNIRIDRQASAAQVVRHKSLRQLVVLSECSPEFHSEEACVGFSHWVFPYTLIQPLVTCTHTLYGRACSLCGANSWFTPNIVTRFLDMNRNCYVQLRPLNVFIKIFRSPCAFTFWFAGKTLRVPVKYSLPFAPSLPPQLHTLYISHVFLSRSHL